MNDTSKVARQVIVDITIAAPIEDVWKALRDPEQIVNWFGWDAPTLAEEIKFIFLDSATEDLPAHTLQFGAWEDGMSEAIHLETVPEGTRVRLVRSDGTAIDWTGVYEDVTQGWINFFEQLRLALEAHPSEARRTIFLSGSSNAGVGEPSAELGLANAIRKAPGEAYQARLGSGEEVTGAIWHKTHFQTGLTVKQWGEGLLVITDKGISSNRPHGGGSVLLTTYGLSKADFTALEQRWTQWWGERYSPPAN